MASTKTPSSGLGFGFGESGPSMQQYCSKQEEMLARERLQKMGNRKGISSEDFKYYDG